MPDAFSLSQSLPGKLKLARLALGLSTREAAERARGLAAVSHATVASYERGDTRPTLPVLAALATVYGRSINWFIESAPALSGVQYRNLKSKTRLVDKLRFEAEAHRWLDAYTRLERRLGARRRAERLASAPRDVSGRELAEWVRKQVKLRPEQPITSVIDLLERFGIRTLELDMDLSIDGIAAHLGNEHVVVLNSRVSNDRARMNAAHELGHVVYEDCGRGVFGERSMESRVTDFASNLLMSSRVLGLAFKGRSMVRLVQFKEAYGISLAAMIFRAEKEAIIPRDLAKHLWIEFAKRGWRRREPGSVRPDRATRFEQLLDGAIVRGELTWSTVAEITGVREDELRKRVTFAVGMLTSDRDREGEAADETTVLRVTT